MGKLKTFFVVAVAVFAAASATGASAAPPTVVKVGSLPETPSKYNKVFITKYGRASAKNVLLLIPGTSGGAANFSLIGPEIARQIPEIQVWAMDRREQALEDNSMMIKALAGTATPQQALDYYLGWVLNPAQKDKFVPLKAKDYAFMKNWGMKMQLEDARAVIMEAKRAGKTVILGGHSLGASMAAAYATWDFHGHPGYKDIAAIVAIDGGLGGTFNSISTAASAKKALASLDVTTATPDGPWANLLQVPEFAWVAGPFVQIGALAAIKDPNQPSILGSYPLLPAYLKADIPTTNEGALGYALDSDSSPKALSLIQVRAGHLASSGNPRGWKNGEVTTVENIAKAFAGDRYGTNGVDLYFPLRLSVDIAGASSMDPKSPAAKVLGLRLLHLKDVDIPYYVFQTSLTGSRNGVAKGARNFAARSKVPKNGLVIVDAKATTSHLDPLLSPPKTNDFLKTVVVFLRNKIKLAR